MRALSFHSCPALRPHALTCRSGLVQLSSAAVARHVAWHVQLHNVSGLKREKKNTECKIPDIWHSPVDSSIVASFLRSPSGKLVQIEYALNAVRGGNTSIGIKGASTYPMCAPSSLQLRGCVCVSFGAPDSRRRTHSPKSSSVLKRRINNADASQLPTALCWPQKRRCRPSWSTNSLCTRWSS